MPIRKFLLIVLSIMVIITAVPSYGQIIYGSPASGSVQLHYSNWKVTNDSGETKINQWVIPISVFMPIQDNFEARLQVAGCTNDLQTTGEDLSLNGTNDVRLLLSHSFYNDRLLASVGANFPTGKKKLDDFTERDIIKELSENYLDFPIRRLGGGFGFNVLIGGATVAGPAKLGAGLMYNYSGEYEPYAGLAKYDPGDSYGGNVSAEIDGKMVTVVSNIAYTAFGVDKQNGINAFKQSPQVDFNIGGAYKSAKHTFRVNVDYLLRGRHTKYSLDVGDIVEQLKIYGNEFFISARFDYYPSEKWYLSPLVETRQIAANEETGINYLGSSSIFGFGAEIGNRFSKSLSTALGFKYYTGSADGGNLDLNGLQLIISLTASF
jgi:hypothetical protein